MTRLIAAAALFVAVGTGCVYTVEDADRNFAPDIVAPLAGCYWSPADNTYIWWFDTFVDDPNGPFDVQEVWADVYDVPYGDRLVQSFPLQRTADADRWYSDWLGWSTQLDCRYDGYVVDIVAYDRADAWGLKTVSPATD
jgi:hypothetical protein